MGKLKDMIKFQPAIGLKSILSPIVYLAPKHLYIFTEGLIDPVIFGAMCVCCYVDQTLDYLQNYPRKPNISDFLSRGMTSA